MKTIKLIATYSRVSTARQEEEQTIKTQQLVLDEFAQKNGYSIVKEYIDDGWSGDILARPSLDKLRNDAKMKLWDAVLIYDPDRLARRYSYQELVMDELREAGVEVLFITVDAPKNSEDKILYGVRGLFAEYEIAKISERFRLGKLRKVKEGHILVSEALYGYRYIPKLDNKHGYYEINEDEATVVRSIFNWINEGLTLRKVVRKLHDLGIKPRKSKRGVWNTSTLSHLLRNEAYIGNARWGSSYAVVPENPLKIEKYRKSKKTSRKIRAKEDWIIIPVPAIIEKELFKKVGKQLTINHTFAKRNKRNEYLLGGKINCVCGRKRTGEGPQNGKHLYYRCTDRVLSYPLPRTCLEMAINARIVDKMVWEKITELMVDPELITEQINRWLNNKRSETEPSFDNLVNLEKEIVKLKEYENRYNKAYGAGLFTIEKLQEYLIPLRNRMLKIESQIVELKQQKNEEHRTLPTWDEIQKFSEESMKALKKLDFTAKRAIILNVIDKIIGDRESLHVYGYLPIENADVEYCTNNKENEKLPSNIWINKKNVEYITSDRSRQGTTRHVENIDSTAKIILFEFIIKLPPLLVNGVDYGFLKKTC